MSILSHLVDYKLYEIKDKVNPVLRVQYIVGAQ